MSMIAHNSIENARLNPESNFQRPRELLDDRLLTRGQKIAALTRWEQAVMQRLDATSEGMPSNGTTSGDLKILEEIKLALDELDDFNPPPEAA